MANKKINTVGEALKLIFDDGLREVKLFTKTDCKLPRWTFIDINDFEDFGLYVFDTNEAMIEFANKHYTEA